MTVRLQQAGEAAAREEAAAAAAARRAFFAEEAEAAAAAAAAAAAQDGLQLEGSPPPIRRPSALEDGLLAPRHPSASLLP